MWSLSEITALKVYINLIYKKKQYRGVLAKKPSPGMSKIGPKKIT